MIYQYEVKLLTKFVCNEMTQPSTVHVNKNKNPAIIQIAVQAA